MKVRIPDPLRSYTARLTVVEGAGETVGAVIADLDRQFPGIRFRMVDEQGKIRPHMKVFLNEDSVRDLQTRVTPSDEMTIMQALSGG